ncbi:hypothetical protein LY76DRAFT_598975, partial [Colletotrichum caudatum]
MAQFESRGLSVFDFLPGRDPFSPPLPLERRSAGRIVRARRPSQDLIPPPPPPPPLLLRDVSGFRSVYRRCRESGRLVASPCSS